MALRLENVGGAPLSVHHAGIGGLSKRRVMKSPSAEESPATAIQERSVKKPSPDQNAFDSGHAVTEAAPVLSSLGSPPVVEPDMPFNPFLNAVPGISNPYELFKAIVMLPVAILRMIAFTVILLLGLVLTKIALIGARDVLTRPFPAWRRSLLWPVRILARVLLFVCGFHWITIKGKPAPRERAPILVSNHVTFVDPVFIFYKHLPVIVTAEENLKYPVMGAIISAMQVIAINRGSPDSRRNAAGEIKRRAMCNDWSTVMIFPEATTTNGKSLVSFKTGAFTPGYPVQPMVVRYPQVHMDPSWVAQGPSIYFLIFKLMIQFHNYMVVEYLPVIEPSWKEQCNPRLFTERTRMTMASILNVMVSEHSYEDLSLVSDAQKAKDYSTIPVIEFGRFERLYRLTMKEAKAYYAKFKLLDPAATNRVTYETFVKVLALPDCQPVQQVFSLFDGLGRGYFNFRQYVNGLAFISRFEKLRETIDAAYGLCDQDNDGILSFEDVFSSLKDLIPSISGRQIQEVWKKLSKGMERVSRDEFVEALQRDPEYLAVFLAARTDLLTPKSAAAASSSAASTLPDGFVNGSLRSS
ncbi:lysophospholipid acyltransferase LPEAT2 [Selaginella moellendorffii]|nr:lysophospholipid acyltransferase LPEAT2 [Selaginella moellendorffii]|eukprot:XP_002986255.2 lysophospholipid acyltransferase LPEAT2 [Selaginella moellendorffii]